MKWLKKLWNWVRPKKHYKYHLDSSWMFTHPLLEGIEFKNDWTVIRNGEMSVKAGYRWDGCSPKVNLFGIVVGVPDGENDECKYPSMIHDVFCQWAMDIPITKEAVVRIFRDMLHDANWELADVYALAVDRHGPQRFGGD